LEYSYYYLQKLPQNLPLKKRPLPIVIYSLRGCFFDFNTVTNLKMTIYITMYVIGVILPKNEVLSFKDNDRRSPIVRCYYFVLPQRVEDRVLDVLVQKTRTIQQELGSLSPVVEKNINLILANGIRNQEIEQLNQQITKIEEDQENPSNSEVIKTELEVIRQ
jgi:hypothetical protein